MLRTLPNELLLDILEHCDRSTWRSLSLAGRRFQNVAQSLLFANFRILMLTMDMGKTYKSAEDIQGILASPRLLSYIQSLSIVGGSGIPYNGVDGDELFLSLSSMPSLRSLRIMLVFRKSTLDSLCSLLSVCPLDIHLSGSQYPTNYIIPVTRLRVVRLTMGMIFPDQRDFLDQLLDRVAQDIISLDPGAVTPSMKRPIDMAMPKLKSLTLRGSELSGEPLASFLKANPQLGELKIFGERLKIPVLPPTALPQLHSVSAPLRFLSRFVPGRPIKRVCIYHSPLSLRAMLDGLSVLAQSTTPITDLNLIIVGYGMEGVSEIMETAVTSLPRLEHLDIKFNIDVSDPPPALFSVQPIYLPGLTNRPGVHHQVQSTPPTFLTCNA